VDGAQDNFWRRCCFARLYFGVKSSHVGVDVDGPVYSLHHPTTYECQTRTQGPLTNGALLYLVAKLLLWVPLPERAYTLRLSDKGVEFLVKHRLVQSPHVGWCRI
jgi:hypothetical protein